MCNFSDAFEYDCIQQGMQKGIINNAVSNINSLINNLNVSYDKAINILGIDETIRKEVLRAYKKKYKN